MRLPRKTHQRMSRNQNVYVCPYICGLRRVLGYKRPDFSRSIVAVTLATSDILRLRFLFLLSLFSFLRLTLHVAARALRLPFLRLFVYPLVRLFVQYLCTVLYTRYSLQCVLPLNKRVSFADQKSRAVLSVKEFRYFKV